MGRKVWSTLTRSAVFMMTTPLIKCSWSWLLTYHTFCHQLLSRPSLSSLCSSQASPESRHLTPLPRRPESTKSAATLPAPSWETGWYQGSGTGAHPSPWCIVGLVVQWQSLRRSYQLRYQSCCLSQERVRHHWRLLMTGLTANVPSENTDMYYLIVLFLCFFGTSHTNWSICFIYIILSRVIISILHHEENPQCVVLCFFTHFCSS